MGEHCRMSGVIVTSLPSNPPRSGKSKKRRRTDARGQQNPQCSGVRSQESPAAPSSPAEDLLQLDGAKIVVKRIKLSGVRHNNAAAKVQWEGSRSHYKLTFEVEDRTHQVKFTGDQLQSRGFEVITG